jgi:hypothetical protein
VLLAIRDALAAGDGGAVRLDDLARQVDAEPGVVRAALIHAVARGWIPDVRVSSDAPAAAVGGDASVMACGSSSCAPAPTNPHCRRCPLAG